MRLTQNLINNSPRLTVHHEGDVNVTFLTCHGEDHSK